MSNLNNSKAMLFSDPAVAAEYARLEAEYAELERRGPKSDSMTMRQSHGLDLRDNQEQRENLISIERRKIALVTGGGNRMPMGLPVARMTEEEEVRSMPQDQAEKYIDLQRTLAALERLPDDSLEPSERDLRFARVREIDHQCEAMIERSKLRRFRAEPTTTASLALEPAEEVAFSPEWRTPDVVALARQMRDTRDFSGMPILADALQEAGCGNEEILNHCRDRQPHVRHCWVVVGILG